MARNRSTYPMKETGSGNMKLFHTVNYRILIVKLDRECLEERTMRVPERQLI